jgi:hypothetical protein
MKIVMKVAGLAGVGLLAAGCGGTATPGPAATGSPAATVRAAARPVAVSPSAAAIARRLKAAGIPVDGLIVYNAVTDPNHLLGRQDGYTSKVAWADPRAAAQDAGDERGSIGLGGGVEVFATPAGAGQRLAYLKGFGPPLGDGYDYQAGTAILRLSEYLTPAQAKAYEAAFSTVAG